jgi:SAM-dependent methyltransferase
MSSNHPSESRFATFQEAMAPEFRTISKVMDEIHVRHGLPDHSDVNLERYPWSASLLGRPALYAARMWEYPDAVLSAEVRPGMRCADAGCGMTAFTIYLKEVAHCDAVGIDPDLFESGIRYKGHGVSKEFLRKTGLEFIQCSLESIALASNSFDCVFCLSVIEHLPHDVVRLGAAEIARILKPSGRAVFTVDVNVLSEVSRPLDLIWDSGLIPVGTLDLKWPEKRFGNFCDGKQPADVFGMVLVKAAYAVETRCSGPGAKGNATKIQGSDVPRARFEWMAAEAAEQSCRAKDQPPASRPLWRKAADRAKRAAHVLLKGQ